MSIHLMNLSLLGLINKEKAVKRKKKSFDNKCEE